MPGSPPRQCMESKVGGHGTNDIELNVNPFGKTKS